MDTFKDTFKDTDSDDAKNHNVETLHSIWRDVRSQFENDHYLLSKTQSPPLDSARETRYHDRLLEMQVANTQLQRENALLINQLQDMSEENRSLNQKVVHIDQSLEDLYQDRMSKGAARLEIEALKSDNERLVSLLAQTSEYRQCFSNVEKLTYLKGARKALNTSNSQKIKLEVNDQSVPEQLLWVPNEAINILSHYQLNEEDKVNLLTSLNQTFHSTWSGKVKKVKQTREKEVAALQRQLLSRTPYDQMQAQKQIARLKSQLNLQRAGKDIGSDQKLISTIAQLQDAQKCIRSLESRIRELESQVSESKETLEKQELGATHRKAIFLKGATWMIDRITEELNSHREEMDRVSRELSVRIDSLIESHDIMEHQIISRVYKWLTDVVHHTQSNLYDRIASIARSTQQRQLN